MIDPIAILRSGRCGSSMVAQVFAEHGVWHGGHMSDEGYPTVTYENRALRDLVQTEYGGDFLSDIRSIFPIRDKIEDIIKGQGYEDGPWMFKHGAQYYTMWEEWEPSFIFVKRPLEDILASYDRCGWLGDRYTPDEVERIVVRSVEVMDSLDGIEVFSDQLIDGDYSSLEEAFEYCDILFKQSIADAVINPNEWTRND